MAMGGLRRVPPSRSAIDFHWQLMQPRAASKRSTRQEVALGPDARVDPEKWMLRIDLVPSSTATESRTQEQWPARGQADEHVVGQQTELIEARRQPGREDEETGPCRLRRAGYLRAAHVAPGEEGIVRRPRPVQADPVRR